jgi:NTP pyrophosphatase (non-canonical NTP hydrolase)
MSETLFQQEIQYQRLLENEGLDGIAADIHKTAVEKQFWTEQTVTMDQIGAKLALVHSEVTEVLEALRKNKGSYEVVSEMADVMIRLLDLFAALKSAGIVEHDIDDCMAHKMAKNKARPPKHGHSWG